jgi:hypothetical protein
MNSVSVPFPVLALPTSPVLTVDAELHRSSTERMRSMGALLAKARDAHYESTAMVKQLRGMVQVGSPFD